MASFGLNSMFVRGAHTPPFMHSSTYGFGRLLPGMSAPWGHNWRYYRYWNPWFRAYDYPSNPYWMYYKMPWRRFRRLRRFR